MIRSTIALAIVVASGCASGHERIGPQAQANSPSVTPDRAPVPPPPPAPVPLPPASPSAPAAAPAPTPLPPGGAGLPLRRHDRPPARGAVRWSAEGCLAATTEAEAKRFPTKRSVMPAVTVAPAPGGATVVHALAHACCLRAEVSSRLEGATAVVVERLTGMRCRCMCSSTLRTFIGLPAGRWNVVVEYEAGGSVRQMPAGTVDVARR